MTSTEKLGSLKGFIDPYFFTNPLEKWDLCSFAKAFNTSGFTKKDCLYFYREGLQNIPNSPEYNDEQKVQAEKLFKTYNEQKKQNSQMLEALENKSNSHSARSAIFQNRVSALKLFKRISFCKPYSSNYIFIYIIYSSHC